VATTEVEHVDAIGRPLKVGDPVAVPGGTTTLLIGRITAIGAKQIRIVKFGQPDRSVDRRGIEKVNGKLRYPSESVLLDGPDITIYLLKYAGTHK
jgi:hypothetical protein